MSSPIEFRTYARRMTMEDVNNGLQGTRLPVTVDGKPGSAMFVSVGLQYRYQAKVYLDGQKALEWSDWLTVPFVKEGDEEASQNVV